MTTPNDLAALRNLLPDHVRRRLDSGALDHLKPHATPDAVESDTERLQRLDAVTSARLDAWRARVPGEFAHASLDNLPGHLRSQVEEWCLTDTRCLVLQGAVGVGKTHAAYALGEWAAQRGQTVVAHSVFDYMSSAREHISGNQPADAANDTWRMLHQARTYDLLVLDDLGAEKGSEWAQSHLTALLNTRLADELRTVVTTNTDMARLTAIYGQRFASRLYGNATIITLDGTDRRATRDVRS